MRTVIIDDNGAEWSMEILEGDRVNAPTKSVKQTLPTGTSEASFKEIHPFFSTQVAVTGTKSKDQKTTQHAPDARHAPPESTERSHSANHPPFTPNKAKEMRQFGLHPTISVHELLEETPPDSQRHKHVQTQKVPQFTKSHQPILLAKSTSSSSSMQNSSGSKADEGGSALPVYSFMEYETVPAVVYTKSESEADNFVQTLKGPLGFDLEWRVMWHPGAQERRTALVQLCDRQTILLIQVSSMKRFPRKVKEVIESADIVKTGANILNDGEKLYRDFGIRAKALVELGAFATKADDKFRCIYNRDIVSLAKMVAMYLDRTLLKGQVRTSNWEANLSSKMVEYAANDCYCALMVYDRLQAIAAEASKTLDQSTYTRQVNPALKPKLTDALLPGPTQHRDGPRKPALPDYCISEPPRPQQLRAYKLWHVDKMPLEQMCIMLRTGGRVEPLKESTVISYVVGALQADSRLPFNMDELKALVRMEAGSWQRHRQWIVSRERY